MHKEHGRRPYSNKYKKFLDKAMYPIGILGPLMMAPQVLKIYTEKDASSIAVSSWCLFLFVAFFWFLYGVAHKERVIIISNIAWIIGYVFIILGAAIY